MPRRNGASPTMEYSVRQRMSLVLEADATAEAIGAMRDAEIDHAFLLAHHISPTLLRAAKITPLQLKAHGTNSAAKLAELGFGPLHLLDESWCAQCVEKRCVCAAAGSSHSQTETCCLF